MTETYDSEILNRLKINEAPRGWLSSFMPLACRLKRLQKGPLFGRSDPTEETGLTPGGGLGCVSQEHGLQRWLSLCSFFPEAEWPQATEALSGPSSCPCKIKKTEQMICKFAPALVILISQGPGSLHETEFATDGSRRKKKNRCE